MNEHIQIEEFDSSRHSVNEITDLLHRSYKKLLDMGLHFKATMQSSDVTLKRLTSGISYIAKSGKNIVGTISYYDDCPKNNCTWYQNDKVSRFGQFAVDPQFQKKGIGAMLILQVENTARSRGKLELALDTSEKALHLIEYYEKKGFRFIDFTQWDGVNYRSAIMSKGL